MNGGSIGNGASVFCVMDKIAPLVREIQEYMKKRINLSKFNFKSVYRLNTASFCVCKKNVIFSSPVSTESSVILFYMRREKRWKTEIIFLAMRKGG